MDKKIVVFIKRKFPGLFASLVKISALVSFVCELDRGRYLYCLLRNKPYFGTVALAGQTWEERKFYMTHAVQSEIKNKAKAHFHLLEIGSWAGDSAVLWADAIKSAGCKGMVLCIDSWKPYVKEEYELVNAATIIMNRALKNDKIFKLFLHNIKASNHSDMITPIKGSSEDILPFLQKESFDMIYVDGDHSYFGVKKDLKNAEGLIADGGILCGDDFDLTIDQIDRDYAEKNKEANMVIDPKTKQVYHPGVCLALSEFFDAQISCYNGFWIMRKSKGRWEQVHLRSSD